MNPRRIPGLLYAHRYACIVIVVLLIVIVSLLFHWGIVCTDLVAWRHVTNVCTMYRREEAVGNLCQVLCETGDIHSPTCQSFHYSKEAVFKATWHTTQLVFKKVREISPGNHIYWIDASQTKIYPSESEFKTMIRYTVLAKFNLSISNSNLVRLGQLKPAYEEKKLDKRHHEMETLWPLLQDHEYLCSTLYTDRDVFPQLLGSCGRYFAVEYVEPLQQASSLFSVSDSHEEWVKQLKLSLMILKYLEELDNGFSEPFHLCDIKLHHFGIMKGGNTLKFIDLDMVYPKSVINRIISETEFCNSDDQCDYIDCRSRCNLETHKCDMSVTNNNLQIVCEKIFLGWTKPNKVIVPGLLMTQYTPSSLATLLRQCANPSSEATKPRDAANDDIRDRLVNIVTEMEQEISSDMFL